MGHDRETGKSPLNANEALEQYQYFTAITRTNERGYGKSAFHSNYSSNKLKTEESTSNSSPQGRFTYS